MEIQPQTIEEARDLVWSILKQGDSRYNDFESEIELSYFILKQAISIEEKEFPEMEETKLQDILDHNVQGEEKEIAKKLLKMKGFKENEIFFEVRFHGSAPDVLVEKDELSPIVVECCSCRVSKIIEFLPHVEEIWILTRGADPWDKNPIIDKMQWFIFRKGTNWDKAYQALQKKKWEELKKVKSPLDGL